MLNQEMNLATLCLRLCEEMGDYFADSGYRIKPMPKDEAFEKAVAIGEDGYRALYTAVCGMFDTSHGRNGEIVVSTYQTGIVITGLEIADKDLYNLCSIENGKYLIQRSRLGIALAFLRQEQVKIERVYGEKDGIMFVFPKGT